MNVLEVVQRFTNAVGLPEPSTAVANPADDVVQIVELLNQEGRALARRHDWQSLTYEATFTTVAAESQGTLASIIGSAQSLRKIIDETIWNRTLKQPVYGPKSPKQWQAMKAYTLSGTPNRYRIRNNTLFFYPAPTAGQTCAFEYISERWCRNSGGTAFYTNVAADTDVFLLDPELILAGLEWRWLRRKGLSYAEEFASYEALVNDAISAEGVHRTLSMDECPRDRRPGVFIPEGSWPL